MTEAGFKIKFSPSLRGGDLLALGESAEAAVRAGAESLHIDIMDGHFAKDYGFNLQTIETLAKTAPIPLDVHMMVFDIDTLIAPFLSAPIRTLWFHPETAKDAKAILREIKRSGKKAGIALAPNVSLFDIAPLMTRVDEILVLTVTPGEGGGAFHAGAVEKIGALKDMTEKIHRSVTISVDGGLNVVRARTCVLKGADKIIMGNAFFSAKDREGVRKAVCYGKE